MSDRFCICLYKTFIDEPAETWSTILEFLFSIVIGVCGVIVNYRFWNKLKDEKRNKPLGRKGNVIEPIMRWYCIFQIVFWPYELLYLWMWKNELIPGIDSDKIPNWLCSPPYNIMKFGRMCICFNSLFVALTRYVYIVHQQKANQWDFEKVGKRIQIASIAIPIAVESMGFFTNPMTGDFSDSIDGFKQCIAFYQGSNSTDNVEIPKPAHVEWTMYYLPESLVLTIFYTYMAIFAIVGLNIPEAILYLKIFQCVRR